MINMVRRVIIIINLTGMIITGKRGIGGNIIMMIIIPNMVKRGTGKKVERRRDGINSVSFQIWGKGHWKKVERRKDGINPGSFQTW